MPCHSSLLQNNTLLSLPAHSSRGNNRASNSARFRSKRGVLRNTRNAPKELGRLQSVRIDSRVQNKKDSRGRNASRDNNRIAQYSTTYSRRQSRGRRRCEGFVWKGACHGVRYLCCGCDHLPRFPVGVVVVASWLCMYVFTVADMIYICVILLLIYVASS